MNRRRRHKVEIINRQKRVTVPQAVLKHAAETAFSWPDEPANLNIVIVDDDEISALNRRFLGHEGPTDVLAFQYRDNSQSLENEIIVNADCAVRESGKRGHGLEAELALYVIHGALHLSGYDDGERESALRMRARQLELARSLGLELSDHRIESEYSGG